VKTIISIEGMTCGHCVAHVEKALKAAVADAGYVVTGIHRAKAGFSLFGAGMVFL